jgi:ubiquitin carboxyl-terminal hydrolase 34
MITMLKEKVNIHFSFPPQLNMSGYMEKNFKPSLPNNQSLNGSPLNEQIETNDNNDIISSNSSSSSSSDNSSSSSSINNNEEDYIYELIGVTANTGTGEGGHYYSFIRERNQNQENCSNNNDGLDENLIETNTTSNTSGNSSSSTKAKWYLFNDADVKPFDAVSQLASECFGGELVFWWIYHLKKLIRLMCYSIAN